MKSPWYCTVPQNDRQHKAFKTHLNLQGLLPFSYLFFMFFNLNSLVVDYFSQNGKYFCFSDHTYIVLLESGGYTFFSISVNKRDQSPLYIINTGQHIAKWNFVALTTTNTECPWWWSRDRKKERNNHKLNFSSLHWWTELVICPCGQPPSEAGNLHSGNWESPVDTWQPLETFWDSLSIHGSNSKE